MTNSVWLWARGSGFPPEFPRTGTEIRGSSSARAKLGEGEAPAEPSLAQGQGEPRPPRSFRLGTRKRGAANPTGGRQPAPSSRPALTVCALHCNKSENVAAIWLMGVHSRMLPRGGRKRHVGFVLTGLLFLVAVATLAACASDGEAGLLIPGATPTPQALMRSRPTPTVTPAVSARASEREHSCPGGAVG